MYYRDAAGALIVFDITDSVIFSILTSILKLFFNSPKIICFFSHKLQESFVRSQHWLNELYKAGRREMAIFLVGNKLDLEENRKISHFVISIFLHFFLVIFLTKNQRMQTNLQVNKICPIMRHQQRLGIILNFYSRNLARNYWKTNQSLHEQLNMLFNHKEPHPHQKRANVVNLLIL